ncbi:MAG: SHD1 domain-containing protein [Verrucomicrobiota bacterium]
MKSFVPSLTALVLGFASLSSQAETTSFRIWKNTDGVSIEARLIEQKESSVLLELRNAKRYDVALEKLSPDDLAWLESRSPSTEEDTGSAEVLAFPSLLANPGDALYEDDLSEIRDGWKSGNGEWTVEEGALVGKELEADNHAGTFKRSLPITDAIIQFSFQFAGAKATTFSLDNSTGHLCRVFLRPDSFSAAKDDNDKDKGPDEGARYNMVKTDLADEDWHTVQLELVGDTMLVQLDGEADEVSLGTHEMLAGEKTKLGFTISGESVHYKDFRVWQAQPKEDWQSTRDRLAKRLN